MQDDTARADLGVAADLDIAEHFCPSAQQHAVAHFRVPVAALFAGATKWLRKTIQLHYFRTAQAVARAALLLPRAKGRGS